MSRVAVVGLDAAESQFVERLMNIGEMPQLSQLRARSARFQLATEKTWRSGRVWETFLTGAADYPSAIVFDPINYETFLPGARLRAPFYAAVPGIRLVALDVPYMSLWHEVDGAQVTAWGGHDAGYPRASHPAGLLREIDSRFGHHPAHLNDFNCGWHHAPSIESLTSALIVGARRRAEVVGWLLERIPEWDLFMTVLSEAHSAGEYFWHGIDPSHPLGDTHTAKLAEESLIKTHRAVDKALGSILECLPADGYVVACSVHGMQKNYYDVTSMVIVPELLYRWHFGRAAFISPDPEAWQREGCPPIAPPQDQKWTPYMWDRFADGAIKSLRRTVSLSGGRGLRRAERFALALMGRRRAGLEELSVPIPPETELGPREIGQPMRRLDWHVSCWYRRHWPSMKAFALPSFYDSRIRINLRGRESGGLVAPSDYDRVCSEVEDLLEECLDGRTGRPAIGNIARLRAGDPYDPEGPDADLLATWSEPSDALEHPRLGMIGPFPFRRTGGHTAQGFAFVAGPSIEPGERGTRSALDLTPTIVSLLGHDPATGIEGRPMLIPEQT
jgi:hypothetical protein